MSTPCCLRMLSYSPNAEGKINIATIINTDGVSTNYINEEILNKKQKIIRKLRKQNKRLHKIIRKLKDTQ